MDEARGSAEGDEATGDARVTRLGDDTAAGDGEDRVLRDRAGGHGATVLIQGEAVDRGARDESAAVLIAHADVSGVHRSGDRREEGRILSSRERAEACATNRVRTSRTDVGGEGCARASQGGVHEDVRTDRHVDSAHGTCATDLCRDAAGQGEVGDSGPGGGTQIGAAKEQGRSPGQVREEGGIQHGALSGGGGEIDGAGTGGHGNHTALDRQRRGGGHGGGGTEGDRVGDLVDRRDGRVRGNTRSRDIHADRQIAGVRNRQRCGGRGRNAGRSGVGNSEGLRGRSGAVAEESQRSAVQGETDAVRRGVHLAAETAVDVGGRIVEDQRAPVEDVVGGEEAVGRAAVGQGALTGNEDAGGRAGAAERQITVADLRYVQGVRSRRTETGEGARKGGVGVVVADEQGASGAGRVGNGAATRE